MKKNGSLPKVCQGPLLTTAAFVDLSLLILIAVSIYPYVSPYLGFIPTEFRGLALALALLPVGWIVFDLLLGGRSPGRWVLGLELCDEKTGKDLSVARRTQRGLIKVGSMGLGGVNPVRPAVYDRKCGAAWRSPMAPRPLAEPGDWVILFRNGQHAGRKARLKSIRGFRERRQLRLGRDTSWSDIPLNSQEAGSVSMRHCVLRVQGGRLFVVDGSGDGRGSSNGTIVDGRKLGKGQQREITDTVRLSLAGIEIDLMR